MKNPSLFSKFVFVVFVLGLGLWVWRLNRLATVEPSPLELFEGLPRVISPTELPDQGDPFEMSFTDVGSDFYEVHLFLCKEYQNDGINPCLDGEYFFGLKRSSSDLWGVMISANYYPGLHYRLKDGVFYVSNPAIPLFFEDSVRFEVCLSTFECTDATFYR